MARSKKQLQKIVLKSELSERQIEKDVSNYLGSFRYENGNRLRLFDSNEAFTGADALIAWRGRLLYFQFKAPTGLTPLNQKSPKSTQPSRKIRKYRFDNDLHQEPYSIYFKLRDLAKTAKEFQHNLLFQLDQSPHCRACYVVPTILKSQEYAQAILYDPIPLFPFVDGLHRMVDSVQDFTRVIPHIPYLKAHAVIRPHAKVQTHEHHYSVSIHGGDVAFHSEGETITRDVTRLSDLLAHEIRDAYENREQCPTIGEMAVEVFQSSQSWLEGRLARPDKKNGLEWLQEHGKIIREEFGISQFLLLLADRPRQVAS